MDVQVGDVDIHALRVPGSTWLDASAAVFILAMIVYVISTVYGLCTYLTSPPREPLLHGQMEL